MTVLFNFIFREILTNCTIFALKQTLKLHHIGGGLMKWQTASRGGGLSQIATEVSNRLSEFWLLCSFTKEGQMHWKFMIYKCIDKKWPPELFQTLYLTHWQCDCTQTHLSSKCDWKCGSQMSASSGWIRATAGCDEAWAIVFILFKALMALNQRCQRRRAKYFLQKK